MPNAFIRKLEGFAALNDDDRSLLQELSTRTTSVNADSQIVGVGDKPRDVQLILDGLAMRCKTLSDGKRQIFAYLIPGDFCDLHVAVLDAMDHDIVALTKCTVARISRITVEQITETRPKLAKALWWCTLVDEATLREWLVNLGQRPTDERIAHLFCELHTRLKAVGLTVDGSFGLPITQDELADTVGVSPVHVNRSLKTLREAGLVVFRGGTIVVPDMAKLKNFAGFNQNYLHLRRGPAVVNHEIATAASR